MADLTIKQHDTWPLLRMKLSDAAGPLPLSTADSLKLILVGPVTIVGVCNVIEPPDSQDMNASYRLKAGELDLVGSYRAEVEITWDSSSTPPAIETVPNTGTAQVVIEADLG